MQLYSLVWGNVLAGLGVRAKFFEHEPRSHEQKNQKTGIFCGLTVQTAETASKNTHKGCFLGAADRTKTDTKFYFRGILRQVGSSNKHR